MSQELIFKDRILGKYSQGVFCSSTNKEEKKFVGNLSCVFPRIIMDDKKQERYIKFLRFDNLGKMVLEGEKFTYETEQEQITNRVIEDLKQLTIRTEQIVLGSIYDKLSNIAMIRTSLNPIYSILKKVYEGNFKKTELLKVPNQKREKHKRYLKFLCELNVLRERDSDYSEGNHFIELRKALDKEDDKLILDKVFGMTIRDGKNYLFNNLNFNILKPFIRISNVYYLSSALVGEVINMNRKTFYLRYLDYYDLNTPEYKFESYLDQLNKAKILKEEEYVFGYKDIFSSVINKFSKVGVN